MAMTLDVVMPDLDGWTVLAALKGDPELSDIAVILLTILDEKNRGYTLGAADYMVKPVDRERLASVLRNESFCRLLQEQPNQPRLVSAVREIERSFAASPAPASEP